MEFLLQKERKKSQAPIAQPVPALESRAKKFTDMRLLLNVTITVLLLFWHTPHPTTSDMAATLSVGQVTGFLQEPPVSN